MITSTSGWILPEAETICVIVRLSALAVSTVVPSPSPSSHPIDRAVSPPRISTTRITPPIISSFFVDDRFLLAMGLLLNISAASHPVQACRYSNPATFAEKSLGKMTVHDYTDPLRTALWRRQAP